MEWQQCPNGHIYDSAQNSSCPFCGTESNVNVTVPLDNFAAPAAGGAFPVTMPLGDVAAPQGGGDGFPVTTPLDSAFQPTQYISDAINDKGIMDVRGWLVCLEGEKKGMDFKIHSEMNSIGRGNENDIRLDFDSAISQGVNAKVAYDARNNKFFIFMGETKNNIYVNGSLLMTPIELKDYDIIEIGTTKMIFRSLCNEFFNWENGKKEA